MLLKFQTELEAKIRDFSSPGLMELKGGIDLPDHFLRSHLCYDEVRITES